MEVYVYRNCDTCRKALKWLREKKVKFEEKAIRETPPRVSELALALDRYDGDLKRILNTSGQDYRDLNLKERLPDMSKEEVLALMAKNGNLVKRPFAVGEGTAVVGFREEEWERVFN